jgi:serine/threonine-protein kinase
LSDFSQPVEIEAAKNWSIEASKFGFDDFKQPITFDERAEKTFAIALQPRGPVAAAPAPVAPRPAPVAQPAQAAQEPAGDTEPKAPSGTCSLNFNSLPVSNVVFDGKPIGGTPKVGYSASAGTHTVVFINAEEGKKVTSVTCKSGESKTVAVRLNQ